MRPALRDLACVVVAAYARTPFGSMMGALSSLTACDLGGAAIRGALSRSGVDPSQVTPQRADLPARSLARGHACAAPARQICTCAPDLSPPRNYPPSCGGVALPAC
mmetsp:Transcript_49858/g.159398  ORF Transcript_49858/g.159398 Transcript_49858/m.159398 type:complete len:106 (+) Transcript_49858:68-385(+)